MVESPLSHLHSAKEIYRQECAEDTNILEALEQETTVKLRSAVRDKGQCEGEKKEGAWGVIPYVSTAWQRKARNQNLRATVIITSQTIKPTRGVDEEIKGKPQRGKYLTRVIQWFTGKAWARTQTELIHHAILNGRRGMKEIAVQKGSACGVWWREVLHYLAVWAASPFMRRRKKICCDMWKLRAGAESTRRGPVKHVEIGSRKAESWFQNQKSTREGLEVVYSDPKSNTDRSQAGSLTNSNWHLLSIY